MLELQSRVWWDVYVTRWVVVMLLTMLFVGTLAGIQSPVELPDYPIVSDGAAPKTVLLGKVPPQGSSHALDMYIEIGEAGSRRKSIEVVRATDTFEDVTKGTFVVASRVSGFRMLRNDLSIDAAKQKLRMESIHPRLKMRRGGDYISGNAGAGIPISFHSPTRPIHSGESWEGWSGSGAQKSPVKFTLDSIIHSKGRTLAVISFQYVDQNSDPVSVRGWTDVDSGWTVKEERTVQEQHVAPPLLIQLRSFDPKWEH